MQLPCGPNATCSYTACIGPSCPMYPRIALSYRMKVRCPVCGGTGHVDPMFQSGIVLNPNGLYGSPGTGKVCPACNGTGMQEVTVTVP